MRDLGLQWVYWPVLNLDLGAGRFVPEKEGLQIQGGGSAWSWDGKDNSGEPVPNGSYAVVLAQPGLPELKAGVWIEHSQMALEPFVLAPQPARSSVTAYLNPPPGAEVALRVYDLVGGLVVEKHLPMGQQRWTWDLTTASGYPVGPGVYVVEARYSGLGAAQSSTLKLAVFR